MPQFPLRSSVSHKAVQEVDACVAADKYRLKQSLVLLFVPKSHPKELDKYRPYLPDKMLKDFFLTSLPMRVLIVESDH